MNFFGCLTTIAILAATAADEQRFNLVCDGESYSVKSMLAPRENVRSFSWTYRVDLRAGQWCTEECVAPRPIIEVTDNAIVFEKENRGTLNDTITLAYRHTGVLFSRFRLGEFASVAEANCRKVPFTGFPARRF